MANPPVLTSGGARCIYCQAREADTEDHVPPRFWVPAELRNGILRVPSCRPCNQGYMKDDEYVRAKLMLRPEVGSHPASRAVLDSVVRGAGKHKARGLKNRLMGEFRSVEAITPAGLYAGRITMPTVEPKRLHRVVERLVQALYYHETTVPLPAAALVTVDVFFERNAAQQETARRYLTGQPSKGLCGDTLRYMWRPARENAQGSVWVIVLYRAVPFFAVTVGPDEADDVRLSAAVHRSLLPF